MQPPRGTGVFSLTLVGLAGVVLGLDRTPGRAIGLSVASGLTLGLGGAGLLGALGAVDVPAHADAHSAQDQAD